MDKHLGHCLCGSVTFEYSGPEFRIGHCHCESCRRCTSSPYTTFFAISKECIKFTGDQPKVYESSKGTQRLFCGNCGSPMGFKADRYPTIIHLYVASLENSERIDPEFHGHVGDKVTWISIADGLPQFERSAGLNPTDRKS